MIYFKNRIFLLAAFFYGCNASNPIVRGDQARGEVLARGCNAMSYNYNQAQGITTPFIANFSSDTYQIGTGIYLFILARKNTYITIIDQGSDLNANRNQVLFKNTKLLAGEKMRFPPIGYKLTAKPPTGINTFEIRFSHEKTKGNESKKEANGRDAKLEKLPEAAPARCIMTFEVIQ